MIDDWPSCEPAPSTAVTAALQHVRTTVAVAQGLARTGRSIDLTGLDAAAGMLCAQVLDLPPDEGAALRPALSELQTRLSALAHAIGSQAQ